MRKTGKKLFTSVLACAMVLGTMPAITAHAGQNTDGMADGTAYLNINNADWADFEAEYVNAEITGDGSYTVSMTAKEAQNLAQFNALEVVNGEAFLGTASVLTVDSISINGTEVELQGPSYTCSADGGGVVTRVNVYNEWNAPDATATAGDDGHLDQRIAEGNLEDATACLFTSDYLTGVESIEVAFTVSNFGVSGEAQDAQAGDAVVAEVKDSYNGYIGFQSPTYTFRNQFDEPNYGRETEYFNQITGWTASGEAVAYPGTLNDVEILGNGTYTVSATDLDFGSDFDSQDHFNLIFLSTDIPANGDVTISDVVLKIDGKTVENHYAVNPDESPYLVISIQNIWSDDENLQTIGYYNVPPTSLAITFTVAGMPNDNPDAMVTEEKAETTESIEATTESTTEESVAETTSTTETEKKSNTGLIVGIIVAVVVVAAVVCAVVMKKKKETK